MAVVATLSKGYDLDYTWKQVDRGPAKDAASNYIQASEAGGEPPGRWWGTGAKALGLEPGQTVERHPYDLLFGQRKAPDGIALGRPPDGGRKAVGLYARLLAAEPHATAGRKHELRIEATRQTRQSPLLAADRRLRGTREGRVHADGDGQLRDRNRLELAEKPHLHTSTLRPPDTPEQPPAALRSRPQRHGSPTSGPRRRLPSRRTSQNHSDRGKDE